MFAISKRLADNNSVWHDMVCVIPCNAYVMLCHVIALGYIACVWHDIVNSTIYNTSVSAYIASCTA
jgi:hypothetical protein